MSERRYTAKEMRIVADNILDVFVDGDYGRSAVCAMLLQSADADEELEHLREDQIRLVAENARYAARLEAVVKEIDKMICHPSESNCKKCGDHRGNCQCGSLSNNEMMKLLKFAKGE